MPARKENERDSGNPGDTRENSPAAPMLAPTIVVPIDSLQPNPWNPNVEDPATFNDLVDNIKQYGFTGAIDVVPLEEEGVYRIIGGEHRWKAAKIAGLKEITISVVPGWDEDQQKAQTIKLNVMKGRLDPSKFTKLFKELEAKYGRDIARQMVGMGRKDAEFRRLMKDVKQSLPEQVQRQIEKHADKIRNVEDLAAVVNSLYARYGGTLQYGFVMFSYGGKTHLMVQMSDDTFKAVKRIADDCENEGKNINEEILRRLVG